MGNDPSKRASTEEDDPDGPIRVGGPRSRATRASTEDSVGGLDGHTPYQAHQGLGVSSPPRGGEQTPRQSFSEDRHSDAMYASIDDPTTASAAAAAADGPVSISSRKSLVSGDIVQISRIDEDTAVLHPEVEALLNLAQVRRQQMRRT